MNGMLNDRYTRLPVLPCNHSNILSWSVQLAHTDLIAADFVLIKLCVVQAANTGIMAGILSVCTVQGKCRVAAHFPLTPAKTIGPRVCDPTIFNPLA